jgi:glutathione S-transferase
VALVLYDNALSSNALKARFLLAELGLAYDRIHVPFDEPRPEWFTRDHPFGRIPLLVDGDVRVGESNTILRYLAAREGRRDLYPDEPAQRARADWAMDTWSTQVRPALYRGESALSALWYPGAEGEPDPDDAAAALDGIRKPLDALERLVADNGTVTGAFSIADCCMTPVLWRWRALPFDSEAWPKLTRIRDTNSGRPAFDAAGPVA